MNIIIKGIHIDVSPAVDEYIRKKSAGLEKFMEESSKLEVDISKSHRHQKSDDAFKVEYKAFLRGEYMQGTGEAEDVYGAIDTARDELFMGLSSKKDKKMTMWKRGGLRVKNIMKGIGGYRRRGKDLDA